MLGHDKPRMQVRATKSQRREATFYIPTYLESHPSGSRKSTLTLALWKPCDCSLRKKGGALSLWIFGTPCGTLPPSKKMASPDSIRSVMGSPARKFLKDLRPAAAGDNGMRSHAAPRERTHGRDNNTREASKHATRARAEREAYASRPRQSRTHRPARPTWCIAASARPGDYPAPSERRRPRRSHDRP